VFRLKECTRSLISEGLNECVLLLAETCFFCCDCNFESWEVDRIGGFVDKVLKLDRKQQANERESFKENQMNVADRVPKMC